MDFEMLGSVKATSLKSDMVNQTTQTTMSGTDG